MFFLLYVPSLDGPISEAAIEALSEQFTRDILDQVREKMSAERGHEGAGSEEISPDVERDIRNQLASMMIAVQKNALRKADAHGVEASEEALSDGSDSPQLIAMRNFLEQCYRRSA